MNFRKVILWLIAGTLAVTVAPARAASDNPFWRVETNLPLETIQGEWTVAESGRSAALSFEGVNVTGQETTFSAGWRSPWVKASHLEVGELNVVADPIAAGDFKVMTRIQAKRRGWGPWFKLPMSWADGGGNYLWMGAASSSSRGLVRYDWKMIGTVIGTAHIEGSAEISVN